MGLRGNSFLGFTSEFVASGLVFLVVDLELLGGTLLDFTGDFDFTDVSLDIDEERLTLALLIESLSDSEAVLDFLLNRSSEPELDFVKFFLNLLILSSEEDFALCASDSEATLIGF